LKPLSSRPSVKSVTKSLRSPFEGLR
jgi:hypothetical protein